MIKEEGKFNLEERTARFAEACIRFCKIVPQTLVSRPIILQLVRSATSIGANYCEANNAESRNDFRHKIGICRKESKETAYWFRMICIAQPEIQDQATPLKQEATELTLIFNAITNKLKSNQSNIAN
jgi:four helix bundle protein